MDKVDVKELEKEILERVALAYRRLVEQKRKDDGKLVFSKDGKIFIMKARDIVLDGEK